MKCDDLYAHYDGAIPYIKKQSAIHGSYESYYTSFVHSAHKHLSKRCADLKDAIIAWRIIKHYNGGIQLQMLNRLSRALFKARYSAVSSFDLSSVAVTAPPIKIA